MRNILLLATLVFFGCSPAARLRTGAIIGALAGPPTGSAAATPASESAVAVLSATDYYKLENVRRIEKDLYRSGKLLIETRYCYHYAYGETAILKYEGSSSYSGSKIIWEDDDSPCDVKRVIAD